MNDEQKDIFNVNPSIDDNVHEILQDTQSTESPQTTDAFIEILEGRPYPITIRAIITHDSSQNREE
jgi:hypothetical protein